MKFFVGQTRLSGSIVRYAERFSLLELRADAARLPGRARLKEWAAAAPPDLVFSLVLPPSAYDPKTKDDALDFASRIAQILHPGWWVFRTPPSLRPTRATREHLAALTERFSGSARIAWEPSGPWDDAGAVATATELGVHLVRDGSRDALPSGAVVYTRLRALGEGASVGFGAAERLAERLSGRQEVYVVVEGQGAGRVRDVLSAELAGEESE